MPRAIDTGFTIKAFQANPISFFRDAIRLFLSMAVFGMGTPARREPAYLNPIRYFGPKNVSAIKTATNGSDKNLWLQDGT